jgi:hypothetical protein
MLARRRGCGKRAGRYFIKGRINKRQLDEKDLRT